MFKFFKSSNPNRGFRNIINSNFCDNPDFVILKSELQDFNDKTIIQVEPNEYAVFVVKGETVQTIAPSTTPVRVSNYPFFSDLRALFYGGSRVNNCSVYFIRTGSPQTNLYWGTPGTDFFTDENMDNSHIYFGGNGCFNFKIDTDNVVKFFDFASMGTNENFTYQQLANKLQPEFTEHFRESVKAAMKKAEYCENIDMNSIASAVKRKISKSFREKYGIILTIFSVEKFMYEDSPKRKEYIQKKATKSEKELNIYLEDKAKRKEILRKALEEKTIRTAIAQGKLSELELLGDQYFKIKLMELAEIGLSNQSLANISTTALGGYLGSNSNFIDRLLSPLLGELLKGNTADTNKDSRNNVAPVSANMQSNFWESQSSVTDEETTDYSLSNQDKENKIKYLEKYTNLLIGNQIKKEAFYELIKLLLTNPDEEEKINKLEKYTNLLIDNQIPKEAFYELIKDLL